MCREARSKRSSKKNVKGGHILPIVKVRTAILCRRREGRE